MVLKCPFCNETVKAGLTDCPACAERMVRSCPACHEAVSVKSRDCKYCGEKLGPERPKPVRRAVAVPAAPKTPDIQFVDEPSSARVPWEDTSRGFLSRWWGTWFSSQLCPDRFFSAMPATGGHRWPVGYAFGLAAQVLVAMTGVGAVVLGLGLNRDAEISNHQVWTGAGVLLAAIPALFLAVTLGLYVSAFLWHLLLKLLGGKAGFEGTLRIVGYSSHTHLWSAIPYVGWLIGAITWSRLHYHGFRNVHKLSGFRAFVATAFPLILLVGAIAAAVAYGCCACDGGVQPTSCPPIQNF